MHGVPLSKAGLDAMVSLEKGISLFLDTLIGNRRTLRRGNEPEFDSWIAEVERMPEGGTSDV
jgi:hypothetical protein